MSILDKINSAEDLKKLSYEELDILSSEIREFIINSVSKTGGHLASNLGTVELTIALNRVYDAQKDRIVFDVGHQCYTHKILNGRKDKFDTLRQLGGIAGFPRPYESDADAFSCGHSSNSVSVALGMARARTLTKSEYNVVAVLGDGSLTGGLAYEGLENAAASMEPIVIILNDNEMSINKNVGGMSKLLQRMRVKPGYIDFKRRYRNFVGINSELYHLTHEVKESIKTRVIPGNMFSELGLYYLGPVDGHNIKDLEACLRWARDKERPVLLHVMTQKGRGCSYAEQHPAKYHGVGPFNAKTGDTGASKPSFGDMMGSYLCNFAEKDEKIVALTAAMTNGTGLQDFAVRFQKRFFDVGICEGHAVSMAAGMAKQGLIPVFAVYSSFLQRGYDMLIQDISLQNLHAIFCIDRAGLVGNDGETHHGTFDIAYMSSVPGMRIFCPSSFAELKEMLHTALYECTGPVAIRYPRGGEGKYTSVCTCDECIVSEGTDITIACHGIMINNVLEAAEKLRNQGISVEIIREAVLKPNSFALAMKSLEKTGRLLVPEDVSCRGCLGEQLLAAAEERGICLKSSRLINLGEGIVSHGSVSELFRSYSLDAGGIAAAAMELINGR